MSYNRLGKSHVPQSICDLGHITTPAHVISIHFHSRLCTRIPSSHLCLQLQQSVVAVARVVSSLLPWLAFARRASRFRTSHCARGQAAPSPDSSYNSPLSLESGQPVLSLTFQLDRRRRLPSRPDGPPSRPSVSDPVPGPSPPAGLPARGQPVQSTAAPHARPASATSATGDAE